MDSEWATGAQLGDVNKCQGYCVMNTQDGLQLEPSYAEVVQEHAQTCLTRGRRPSPDPGRGVHCPGEAHHNFITTGARTQGRKAGGYIKIIGVHVDPASSVWENIVLAGLDEESLENSVKNSRGGMGHR